MSSHIIYEDIMPLFPVVNIDEVRSLAFYEGCLKTSTSTSFFSSFINEISTLLGLSVCFRMIFCWFSPTFTLFCSLIPLETEHGRGRISFVQVASVKIASMQVL